MNNEFTELLNNIEQKIEVRQNLSKIRSKIKEPEQYDAFVAALETREELLPEALLSDDAKTRKNVALLMGDLAGSVSGNYDEKSESTDYMHALYHAYESEQQMFVKSSYLTALKSYDYRTFLPNLKNRLTVLTEVPLDESNKKHITEELHAIDELIVMAEGIRKHEFTGMHVKSNIILTTNRKNVETVEEQIKENANINSDKIKTFSAGIMLQTDCLDEIQKIRTYNELLFRVDGMELLDYNPITAAKQIADSSFLQFLFERHEMNESETFFFRVELKSKMKLSEKSTFVKKLSSEIEQLTDRKLVNNKSNYEVEIRLIETKEGTYNCLVKLYTLEDDRFSYRKESIAASIKPVNAALLVQLAREYMVDDAKVLDPFCGVATLLIERQKIVKGNTAYGIDILPEAIAKAKVNTEAAGQIIHFINKDFFAFEHEYLFDEIFTDMPFETCHKTEEDIREIYESFFKQIKRYLTANGRIIMYTHNRELVQQYAGRDNYKILNHTVIFEKAGTDLFVLEVI